MQFKPLETHLLINVILCSCCQSVGQFRPDFFKTFSLGVSFGSRAAKINSKIDLPRQRGEEVCTVSVCFTAEHDTLSIFHARRNFRRRRERWVRKSGSNAQQKGKKEKCHVMMVLKIFMKSSPEGSSNEHRTAQEAMRVEGGGWGNYFSICPCLM